MYFVLKIVMENHEIYGGAEKVKKINQRTKIFLKEFASIEQNYSNFWNAMLSSDMHLISTWFKNEKSVQKISQIYLFYKY